MDAPDPRLGTILGGRYRLDEQLGAGGMGVVYRAERLGIGKVVAVKFLQEAAIVNQPELPMRFEREMSAMSRLSHPHLTGIIDFGFLDGAPYMVMDFQAGRSLREVLAGPIGARRAVGIATQILAGMRYAHDAGVVHRDLKPDNIILLDAVEGDFVKILDFGLAKSIDAAAGGEKDVTRSGLVVGTPAYMSPEQAEGARIDGRTDLYAVGVLLYQMVAGRKPFESDSPQVMLRMHVAAVPDPPRKVGGNACCSVALERVILRALEKAPAKRWQTAAEFIAALGSTPEGSDSAAPDGKPLASNARMPAAEVTRAATPVALRRRGRGSRFLRTLGAVGLLAAGVAALVWTFPGPARDAKERMEALRRAIEARWNAGSSEPHASPQVLPAAQPVTPATATSPTSSSPPTARPPTPAPTAMQPPAAAASPIDPATPNDAAVAAWPAARAASDAAPAPSDAAASPPDAAPPPTSAARAAGDDEDAVPDDVPDPHGTPGERLEQESARHAPPATASAGPAPAPRGAPHTVREAARLLDEDKVSQAIPALYAVRHREPRNAEVALLLGHAYFRKLWRTDALREYGNAIRLNKKLARNARLIDNAIAALDDPTWPLAHALFTRHVGAAGVPALRRAARSTHNARIQRRAARLAAELAPHHHR